MKKSLLFLLSVCAFCAKNVIRKPHPLSDG